MCIRDRKNTGRCAELLTPNASVYVQRAENPDRKTQWDLIGVKKGKSMINMDSQIPKKVVEEWIKQGNLFPDAIVIRQEKTYRKSRFDPVSYTHLKFDVVPSSDSTESSAYEEVAKTVNTAMEVKMERCV